ncbi:MAG: hypothetical protein FWF51_05025 [Chitinivibrionia bacterium]|jgi:hypothetical protein|nr:hypothetical protein [Chitinivibrionia bacterium]
MLVNNLVSANYFSSVEPVRRKDDKVAESTSKKTNFGHNDAYIPSNFAVDVAGVKAKDLTEIKNRIATGFYDSVDVNEDLTEVFSGIFRKVLPQPR